MQCTRSDEAPDEAPAVDRRCASSHVPPPYTMRPWLCGLQMRKLVLLGDRLKVQSDAGKTDNKARARVRAHVQGHYTCCESR